jgi:ABC-type polysaccharide/polyol phosphate export permease
VIQISRNVLLDGRIDLGIVVVFLVVNVALTVVALRIFRTLEPRFAENV